MAISKIMLEFHTNHILSICNDLDLQIKSETTYNQPCLYFFDKKDKKHKNRKYIDVIDQQNLTELIKAGAVFAYDSHTFYNLEKFKEEYLKRVFSESVNKNNLYVLKNVKKLIGSINVEEVVKLLPSIPDEQKISILEKGHKHFGEIAYHNAEESLKEMIKVIKHIPDHEKLLAAFFERNVSHLYSDVEDSLRDTIITYYPNDLDKFANLSYIKEYLEHYSKNVFIEKNEDHTIHLRIDTIVAKNKYRIKFLQDDDYFEAIVHLFTGLKKEKEQTGVVSGTVSQEDSEGFNQEKIDIYVNVHNNSYFDKNLLKNIINDLFIYLAELCNNKSEEEVELIKYNISETIEPWLHTYVFNNKLNIDLKDKSISEPTKRYKI